ncbi:flagellar protein FlaG [bacterium]|nr:flagellar protein FlaG [bacterium]MBU1994615.1 flagellar protein FlaG [bacterium]
MDGIANVARQQQSQIGSSESQGRELQASQQSQQVQQTKFQKNDVVKEMQQEVSKSSDKINSKEQMQDLVDQLNKAMAPMSTNLKFGFDNSDEVFFVSVIEAQTNKMIRRFPAEKAMDFLPKMQEVTGMLFDSKG